MSIYVYGCQVINVQQSAQLYHPLEMNKSSMQLPTTDIGDKNSQLNCSVKHKFIRDHYSVKICTFFIQRR